VCLHHLHHLVIHIVFYSNSVMFKYLNFTVECHLLLFLLIFRDGRQLLKLYLFAFKFLKSNLLLIDSTFNYMCKIKYYNLKRKTCYGSHYFVVSSFVIILAFVIIIIVIIMDKFFQIACLLNVSV